MSIPFSQVPSDLLMDPDMTLSAIRVWHVVYVETLGRPGWDLSYRQIAEKIGTSRRQTAMEAVALLIDKGWLVRLRQMAAAGDAAPNLFAICREPFVPWNEPSVRSSAQGGAPRSSTGSAPDRTTGGARERTHQKNHLPEESLPEEKITGPSGPGEGGDDVPVIGALDDSAEMPEGPPDQRRKKKPFAEAPKEGTHSWVVYQFERERSRANVGSHRYNKGHLNRLLRSLREDDGMTNAEIVVLIRAFFIRHQQTIRQKTSEYDLVALFQQMIPQLQKQSKEQVRAVRTGSKTTTQHAKALGEDLKARFGITKETTDG